MRGRDFLDTASRLLAAPPFRHAGDVTTSPAALSPSDGRTAAGRAYYALFLELLTLLEESGVTPTHKGYDHAWLRRTMEILGEADDQARKVAEDLKRLRSHRIQADYRLAVTGFHFNRRNVTGLCARAARAIARVDERREALRAGMPAAATQADGELRQEPPTAPPA